MNLTADDLLAMRAGEMNTGLGGLASNLERGGGGGKREKGKGREREGERKGRGERETSL